MELPEITRRLENFIQNEDEYLWMADLRVWFADLKGAFLQSFKDCKADLLATNVRAYSDDPDWHRWSSLAIPGRMDLETSGVAALMPLIRLSQAAARRVLASIEDGANGHPEALIPTLVNQAGLIIEDIGGTGRFTPSERAGRWYDRRTWHWQGPVKHVPGLLHFPTPAQHFPLAEARIADERPQELSQQCKILFASPVGASAAGLLPRTLKLFSEADVECLLLQYDTAELPVSGQGRLIRDIGNKWQLALRHLNPASVSEFDFLFFWDDDLAADHFDPQRFVQIMRTNRLSVAQPSIQSRYGLSHEITKHRPTPPPLRTRDGKPCFDIVGRLTNFVEIMAPVFTREGWREFYTYLNPGNDSGWGYDYIPLGRKGIVDALPVVHTRPVQSIKHVSETDMQRFLESQGLIPYTPVEMGWLLEPHEHGISHSICGPKSDTDPFEIPHPSG